MLKYAENMVLHWTRFYGTSPRCAWPTNAYGFLVWAAVSLERTVAIDVVSMVIRGAAQSETFLHTPAEGLRKLGIAGNHRARYLYIPHQLYRERRRLPEREALSGRIGISGLLDWPLRQQGALPPGSWSRRIFRSLFARTSPVGSASSTARRRLCRNHGLPRRGHAAGLQIVCIDTVRAGSSWPRMRRTTMPGRRGSPLRIASDLPEMYDAFETIRTLADSPTRSFRSRSPGVDALPRCTGSGGHRGAGNLGHRSKSPLWQRSCLLSDDRTI